MKTFHLIQNLSVIFILLLFIVLPQNVSAASEPNDIANEKSSEQTNTISVLDWPLQRHSLEIGPEIYAFNYKEPGGITDKGMFYGGVINYTYRGWVPKSSTNPLPESGDSFHAEFRFASGEADYDGYLSDNTPYTVDNIEYNAYETRLLYGLDFIDDGCLASLSAGLGYRFSNDDSSFDPYGYERESNYIYLPIAYQLDGKYENNWAWGFTMEFDYLIRGKQKSYLSDVGDVDIENDQKSGYGLRASIRLQKKTNAGTFIFEPFIRYWDIDDSEYEYIPPYYYWEPENSTLEVGWQIKWKF